jgi:molecular chaperone GrpE (heat shock protein)
MSDHRQVWETLSRLLSRVESSVALAPAPANTANLEQEIRKLGKTQLKANLLVEEQAAQVKQSLIVAQTAQEQNSHLLGTLSTERAAHAQKDTLEAILPALDGLEHAIASGQRYLQIRDRAAAKPNLTPEQALLVSPADRAILAGWLNGLNLVRERFLAILEASGVTPIPSVGQLFDPYLHVAVGTSTQIPAGMEPTPNTIVAEERGGYRTRAGVIRFAEVVVYRPARPKTN